MEPRAYERLDQLGIRRPRTFSVEEARSLDPSVTLMVRGGQAAGKPMLTTVAELSTTMKALEVSSDEAYSIVEGVASDAGACAVTLPNDGLYIEVVDGHLSGLLRAGWCGGRAYSNSYLSAVMLVDQPRSFRYQRQELRLAAGSPLGQDIVARWAQQVTAITKRTRVPARTMLECVEAPDGQLIFVDIKPYPWDVAFEALLDPNIVNGQLIYNRGIGTAEQWVEPPYPEVDALTQTPGIRVGLSIGNAAVLCHLATYGLRDEWLVEIAK